MKNFIRKYNYQIILFLTCFFLYSNTVKNGYALDDEFVTGPTNITAKGFRSIPKIFKTFHVMDESGNNYEYRPMVKVTFAIEHQFFGENPGLSHFFNIVFYFLCLLVLFKLLKKLFSELPELVVFYIVLIFAFLPVHSEVVASLKNRDVLLCFIFSMLGFYYFLQYFELKKWNLLLMAFLFLCMAFLSKFDVVPMIVIIPLMAYQRKKINVKSIILTLVLFFTSYVVYRATKIILVDKVAAHPQRVFLYFENPLFFKMHFVNRFSALFNSLGFYTKMLVFPSDMSSYYGYNTISVYSFTSLYALLGIAAAFILGYIFFKYFRKPDLLWYGIAFFIFSISMYLNFVVPVVGIVADRFMFFASVGFSIVAGYFLFFYKTKSPVKKTTTFKQLSSYQKAIPIGIFVLFSFLIINRNKDWNSKALLFETDLKKRPESVKLALLKSSQLIININDRSKSANLSDNEKIEKIRSAEDALRKAIKIDSSCGGCYNNLSFMYLTFESRPDLALPYLLLGYKRDTTKKELVCNIGIAYYRLGEIDKAEKYLLRSIELDKKKDFSVPYEVLNDLYLRKDPQKGIVLLKKKLEENPASELYNVLLGKMYFDIRDTANSLRYYKEALKTNPNNQQVNDFVTRIEVKYLKKNW